MCSLRKPLAIAVQLTSVECKLALREKLRQTVTSVALFDVRMFVS